MEKKLSGRSAQIPGKSLAADSKLKQDASNSIKFVRSGRRREGNPNKSDPPCKPLPQRQRGYDKRPQPRSDLSSMGNRYRNQVTAIDDVEVGSDARPGSKKLNLNHLLNFTYNCREGGRLSNNSWGGGPENHGYRNRAIWTTRKHKYNKEQFLQANCQFVVQEGKDYAVHHTDPDLLVDWEWIEQVRVSCHEVPSCPICLYPPVAAKMTRCGHIYCWPCILHYLALSDKTWRKCPICYEAVYKTDLKSVVALTTPCFNVNETITMQLMQRERGSVIALPRIRWKKTFEHPFHVDDKIDTCFAKLLIATKEQVLCDVLGREESELAAAQEENSSCPEVCFVQSAIQDMSARKNSLLMSEARELETAMTAKASNVDAVTSTVFIPDSVKPIVYASAFDDDEVKNEQSTSPFSDTGKLELDDFNIGQREGNVGSDCLIGDDLVQSIGDLEIRAEIECGSGTTVNFGKSQGKDAYYFYQAMDGQHIYMHAINVHMLIREYGSLDQCPDTISAVIVEKEGISMNEELRRRLRYLAHLPLTCEFEVVELHFRKPTVSQETLDAFAEEIEKRQSRRNRRAREEYRRERHLQAEENKKLGKLPSARIHLNSLRHFPEYAVANSDDMGDNYPVRSSENVDSLLTLPATPETFGSPEAVSSCGPSFAQMLREGKAKPKTAALNNAGAAGSGVHSDSDLEEAMPAPSYRDSFGAALQDALDQSAAFAILGSVDNAEEGHKKKKKKSKQKRLLFTTSVIRSK